MVELVELDDEYYKEPKEVIHQLIKIITKATLNGDTLIYRPARQRHRTFLDLQLFANNYWTWCFNPPKIPITFEEFLDNRPLSKYTQKASKEINYGNSNRNSNNN